MPDKMLQVNIGQEKKKNAVWFVLAIAVFTVLVFLVWFYFSKIEKNSQELVLAQDRVALLESQTKEVEKFKAKYQSYKDDFKKIDHIFLDPQNPLDFIKFLENFASESGVKLKISPLSVPKNESAKTLQLQLQLDGNFSDILNFVGKVENGEYLVSLASFTAESSASIQKAGSQSFFGDSHSVLSLTVLTL
jgi:hypothetical protein